MKIKPDMEDYERLLEKYYCGETSIAEERLLKAAFAKGELSHEHMLAFGQYDPAMPDGLTTRIQETIKKCSAHKHRQIWLTAASIAAVFILIISVQLLIPVRHPELQLSDNLKKERFEDALRRIGNALEEKKPDVQRVLYEDHHLIIAIE